MRGLAHEERIQRAKEAKMTNKADPNYLMAPAKPSDLVNHPPHYGGIDDPYEAVKVIEAWKLGFNLGNTIKYICRSGKKNSLIEDLKKARWYLDREISNIEKRSVSNEGQ